MREKVLPKVDEVLADDVRQNEGGSHVDTDRLQQDHDKGEKCPVGVLAHREICPLRLNRNEEHNYRPYQSRGVQLHFGPGQDETTKPEQDLRDCQA